MAHKREVLSKQTLLLISVFC